MEGSVRELERYLGTSFETDAQRIVEGLVSYGALVEVLPFINEHSYEEFSSLLEHLDSTAEAARFLRAALRAFQMGHRVDRFVLLAPAPDLVARGRGHLVERNNRGVAMDADEAGIKNIPGEKG